MNINDITRDMIPQEKEVYFKHMRKRHGEEQEYIEARKEELHDKLKRQLVELDEQLDRIEKDAVDSFKTYGE